MNGNNNGKDASFLTKILTGVVTALLISGVLFGMSVYGFMESGPYVEEHVYEVQQRYIEDELKEIKDMIRNLK